MDLSELYGKNDIENIWIKTFINARNQNIILCDNFKDIHYGRSDFI